MLVLFISLFLVAIVFTMLGQGGGVLYTPLQVFFGIDFHVAATTSLFLIVVASLSSTIVFRKKKKIDWPLAITLESVTTLGGFTGGLLSDNFSGAFLTVLFAGIVAFAAFFMIKDFHKEHTCAPGKSTFFSWKRVVDDLTYCINLGIALPVSFIAGMISGLVGVGGGILKVPMMVLLFGVPMQIAVGSSAFMVGVTALGGLLGHITSGHWDWQTSLLLAAAVFIGGQIGARMSLNLNKSKLKRGFGWFLLLISVSMILKISL